MAPLPLNISQTFSRELEIKLGSAKVMAPTRQSTTADLTRRVK